MLNQPTASAVDSGQDITSYNSKLRVSMLHVANDMSTPLILEVRARDIFLPTIVTLGRPLTKSVREHPNSNS